MRINVK